jgi:hypothetical protein
MSLETYALFVAPLIILLFGLLIALPSLRYAKVRRAILLDMRMYFAPFVFLIRLPRIFWQFYCEYEKEIRLDSKPKKKA